MTEQTPATLTPEQKQYLESVQAAATQLGLDPKNEIHLEATAATMDQMNKIQALPVDSLEEAQRKNQEKTMIAQTLGLDINGFNQQKKQIENDAKSAQRSLKTKGIINFVITTAASIAAGFYTNKYANNKGWKTAGKWAANIGAFIAAGIGAAQLGYWALSKPSENKLKASIENMSVAETEFDKKLVTAMAQHFVKQITEEKAAAAKVAPAPLPAPAVAAPAPAETPPSHPEHMNKEHHDNSHHKTDQHAATHDAHAAAEEARRQEQIKAEIEAGKERDYPSGKHAAEHHHGNHATEHNPHGHHAAEQPVVVEREKNIPFADKVHAPHGSHVDAALASREAAAATQHAM